MSTFFYQLGHCKDLSLAELSQNITLSGETKIQANYLLAQDYLPAHQFGSIPFSGIVLDEFLAIDFNLDIFIQILQKKFLKTDFNFPQSLHNLTSGSSKSKKIGLSILDLKMNFRIQQKWLQTLKKIGFKKVAIIQNTPNYGHFKQQKNWIIIQKIQNKILVGYILDYFDQQFWAQLDSKMPKLDMDRGIINLKLGRSLLNFSKTKNIWDPLAGQGRILIAGKDFEKQFVASDSDMTVLPELNKNWKWADYFFPRKIQYQEKVLPASKLQASFVWNISDNENLKLVKNELQNLEQIPSIVTEGFLGTNYQNSINPKLFQTEFETISKLWQKAFVNFAELEIPEIIFCLPYLVKSNKQEIWYLQSLENILSDTDYQTVNLANFKQQRQSFILYAREKTHIGHQIWKVKKRKS